MEKASGAFDFIVLSAFDCSHLQTALSNNIERIEMHKGNNNNNNRKKNQVPDKRRWVDKDDNEYGFV